MKQAMHRRGKPCCGRGYFLVVLLVLLTTTKMLYDYNEVASTSGHRSTAIQEKPFSGTRRGKNNDGLSLVVGKHTAELLCNKTNEIVNAVRSDALSNETEALLWHQRGPFYSLTCEQLIRSLPILGKNSSTTTTSSGRNNITVVTNENATTAAASEGSRFELRNLVSLQRLAAKLRKLEQASHRNRLTVVVIGGSMTTGWVDAGEFNNDTYNLAFPRKLEQFMQRLWPTVEVINIATGGANENTWLGRLSDVMELRPDVILVESAVNDQCNYDKQDERAAFVNRTSFSLLNLLVNFPQKPAVVSVELFRTATGQRRDANRHCRGYVQNTSDPMCYYCPQWWKPQTWRENARNHNSVSLASYRDAVWPVQDRPPDDLCSKYWTGMSHPEAGVHAMVASTILFQFLVVMEKANALLQLSKQKKHGGDATAADPKQIDVPQNICLEHISSYRAMQEDPRDPFHENSVQSDDHHPTNHDYGNSCWSFRADVRRKYGWVCEANSTMLPPPGNASRRAKNATVGGQQQDHKHLRLSKKIRIGGDRKIIVSRLVSYDDRMAVGQVWFSSGSENGGGKNSSNNVFQGDPVWNVSSWHEDKTSIPQPHAIRLDGLRFKDSLQIRWPSSGKGNGNSSFNNSSSGSSSNAGSVEVTFNLRILPGSSRSISRGGIDKFKLLGIVTC